MIQQGLETGVELLAALLSPFLGQDLYKVGKALTDLSDLGQHVKSVSKIKEQARGDKKKSETEEEVCLGYLMMNVAGFMPTWSS